MNPRPFINKRIDALEQLFADAANQIVLLRLLADELQHRSVPRAVTLRKKVAVAIARHPNGGIPPISDDELPLELSPATPGGRWRSIVILMNLRWGLRKKPAPPNTK